MKKLVSIYGNVLWNITPSLDSELPSRGRMQDRISLEWGQDLDLVAEQNSNTQLPDQLGGQFLLKGDQAKDMNGEDLMY